MENSKKGLYDFYAGHSKEGLQKETSKDEISLCAEAPRIKGRIDQKTIELRIAILKELKVKYKG
jgi:hypothetical protein